MAPPTNTDRRIHVLMLTALINFIGIGIIGPLTPALAARYGADPVTIGLLSTAYAISQFVGVPVLGALSDRFGRRPILLVSLLGAALGYVVFGIGGALWVLFLGRILEGLTNGNISTVFAYTADITGAEERTRAFGTLSAAMGVGLIAGPLLGGLLAGISTEAPIYLVAALTLLNTALAARLLPESLTADRRAGKLTLARLNPAAQVGFVLGRRSLRPLVATSLLLAVAMAALISNLPVLMAERFGWGPSGIATLYALYGALSVLAQVGVLPRLLPRLGEARLGLVGLGVAAGGYAALTGAAMFDLAPLTYLSAMLIGLGSALASTSLAGLISRSAEAHEQGRVQGGHLAVQTLGNIAGPIWGGWLFVTLGHTAPYLTNVVLLAAGAGIMLLLITRRFSEPPGAVVGSAAGSYIRSSEI